MQLSRLSLLSSAPHVHSVHTPFHSSIMGLQKAQNYVHVDTPNPYEADLQTAFELLQREIDETQGWEGAYTRCLWVLSQRGGLRSS